jgi:hypothetical protein
MLYARLQAICVYMGAGASVVRRFENHSPERSEITAPIIRVERRRLFWRPTPIQLHAAVFNTIFCAIELTAGIHAF